LAAFHWQTHGPSEPVHVCPTGHDPRHTGKRPPHGSSVELVVLLLVAAAVVVSVQALGSLIL
jgi:hypothetical protein